MRILLKKSSWLIMGVVLAFSCQEEERISIVPPEDGVSKDSELVMSMQKVAMHDGSYDDMVDGSNCLSINLPYRMLVNGLERDIDEIRDYDMISIQDEIQLLYPINITDYQHITTLVSNNMQLQSLSAKCQTEDDDIECIDFMYPIKLAIFDKDTNIMTTQELGHDLQLFTFMNALGQNSLISINYPIQLKRYDLSNILANHNSELLQEIQNVITDCDEDD